MRITSKFEIPVQDVIDGLKEVEFKHVVVIGRKEDGGLYIASDCSTPETLDLIRVGRNQIDTGEFDE